MHRVSIVHSGKQESVIIERAQNCQFCVQFVLLRRLVVLLPNFVVVIEHIKFWWNHSCLPSNITDIDRDRWNITCRWCQDSYALRENIIPWEIITLLAVHRNVIFHDRPGQYLYNVCIKSLEYLPFEGLSFLPLPLSELSHFTGNCLWGTKY